MKPKMNERNSHLHKCANCGFVWRHLDESEGRDNEEAHTCHCGFQQFYIHRRKGKADVETCERPAKDGQKAVPMQSCYEQDFSNPLRFVNVETGKIVDFSVRPDPA